MFQQYALGWLLFVSKSMNIEVSAIIVVLVVFIDEIYHFFVRTLSLFDVHLLAPFIDSIFHGVERVIKGFIERSSVRTYHTFLSEEISLVMDVIDFTATFANSE